MVDVNAHSRRWFFAFMTSLIAISIGKSQELQRQSIQFQEPRKNLRLFLTNGPEGPKELKNLDHITVAKGKDVKFKCEYRDTKVPNVTFIWTTMKYKAGPQGFYVRSVGSMFRMNAQNRRNSIFNSTYTQSYYNHTEVLACIIEDNTELTVFLDYKIKPRIFMSTSKPNIINCTVLSMKKPDFIEISFENNTSLQKSVEVEEIKNNIYSLSMKVKYWGVYTCAAHSTYGTSKKTICRKQRDTQGDCHMKLKMGQTCWSDSQCQSQFCRNGVCFPRTPGLSACTSDGDCKKWAVHSVCNEDNICECKKGDKFFELKGVRKCVKVLSLHRACDSYSMCVSEYSECISGVCSCIGGYTPNDGKCVLESNSLNSNVPMFVGVSVCVGVFIIIIIIMLIIRKSNLCGIGRVPEERRPDRRNRRRRASIFDSLRRSARRRTPPPSYGRASKPPTYEEALQIEETARRLSTAWSVHEASQTNIRITENTSTTEQQNSSSTASNDSTDELNAINNNNNNNSRRIIDENENISTNYSEQFDNNSSFSSDEIQEQSSPSSTSLPCSHDKTPISNRSDTPDSRIDIDIDTKSCSTKINDDSTSDDEDEVNSKRL